MSGRLHPSKMDLTGTTLAHYRIVAAIGTGGMGEVYRATDTKLGPGTWPLKVLPADMAPWGAGRIEEPKACTDQPRLGGCLIGA